MVAEVERDLGPIDILVNNAGNAGAANSAMGHMPAFWETGPADWEPWIAVNFTGVMLVSRAVVGGMVSRGHGRLITVISDAGRVGEPDLVVYSGAKAGAAGFTRALAKSVGGHGVTANCVALGGVRTPATAALMDNEQLVRRLVRAYPAGRLGEPARSRGADHVPRLGCGRLDHRADLPRQRRILRQHLGGDASGPGDDHSQGSAAVRRKPGGQLRGEEPELRGSIRALVPARERALLRSGSSRASGSRP